MNRDQLIELMNRQDVVEEVADILTKKFLAKPPPGEVVWFRDTDTVTSKWRLGVTCDFGVSPLDHLYTTWAWGRIEWKPAPIHGENELQDRIRIALEYIDTMWPRFPISENEYHADLTNLTAMLEGNEEADE